MYSRGVWELGASGELAHIYYYEAIYKQSIIG